jgi:hypothetical protein
MSGGAAAPRSSRNKCGRVEEQRSSARRAIPLQLLVRGIRQGVPASADPRGPGDRVWERIVQSFVKRAGAPRAPASRVPS